MTQAIEPNVADQHLLNLISELLEVLDFEEKALSQEADFDLEELSDRKLQLLAAFSRAKRDPKNIPQTAELDRKVQELRIALDENRRALEIHIRAVNDVADTISSVIKDHDSDGTYTSKQFGLGSYR